MVHVRTALDQDPHDAHTPTAICQRKWGKFVGVQGAFVRPLEQQELYHLHFPRFHGNVEMRLTRSALRHITIPPKQIDQQQPGTSSKRPCRSVVPRRPKISHDVSVPALNSFMQRTSELYPSPEKYSRDHTPFLNFVRVQLDWRSRHATRNFDGENASQALMPSSTRNVLAQEGTLKEPGRAVEVQA